MSIVGFSNQTIRGDAPMSERHDYEAGVPCWIDALVPDPDAAMAFYAGLFGWEFAGPGDMPGDPPGRYHVARLRGRDVAGVGSQPAGAPASWNTYVYVHSADDAARAAREAGGTVVTEPFDAAPAGRLAVLADPAGAVICVWEPGERKGAQVINEPGAWSMSNLRTPDPERAASFYGTVFGWTTEPFGAGEEGPTLTLFRVPGYVGGEPRQPVSREVVATMGAANGDGAAQWSLDFWDRDVDATAAKAVGLGGSVVAGPFDTPMSRTAVLADPHGLAFTVSNVPG
jgi:predicted enzyme related to lactoylglutathione lyase